MNDINYLYKLVLEYNKEEFDRVKKAYEFASFCHSGQLRASGEDYIIHPVNVATILAEMHVDGDTLCAALLHDVVEDTSVTIMDITREFGLSVSRIVDGVTKLNKMDFISDDECNYANTRKIVTSFTKDLRIIFVKLADRLHNMLTLEYKEPKKRMIKAKETMEIYVPLAKHIGAYQIAILLEDLSMKYLMPDEYRKISDDVDKFQDDNLYYFNEMFDKVRRFLNNANVPNEMKIQIKNTFGIYKKLQAGHTFKDMHDLISMKIIVDSVNDCYKSLGIVHRAYPPVNEHFKDYIANPKPNMYQALHTTVFGKSDELVQFQIKTLIMEQEGNLGIISYFDRMRESAYNQMRLDLFTKYGFLKTLLEIDSTFDSDKSFVKQVKRELFSGEIDAYTNTGKVIGLPKGASIVDFAYKVLGEDADNTMYALVNGKRQECDYLVSPKDRIRIVTGTNTQNNNWEDYAITTSALKRIRNKNTSN